MIRAITDIIPSFYSQRFYSDVAHKREGIGIVQMLVLTLLMFLFISPWKIYTSGSDAIRQFATVADVDSLPDLIFKDNKLSINKPVPYLLKLGTGKDSTNIVIDTNYKITDVDALSRYMVANNVIVLLTEDSAVMLKDNTNEIDIKKYGKIQDVVLEHTFWKKFLDGIVKWGILAFAVSFVVFYILFVFLFNLIASLLTALLVLIGSSIIGRGLGYEACVRLVSAYRIPMHIICALPMLAGKPELEGGSSWLVWLAYLAFVLYASKIKSDFPHEH